MSFGDDLRFDEIELDRVMARVRASIIGDDTRVCIGRFVIEERVGAGGMGIVYRARDPQLDRTVALKLMRPSIEARGLGRLLQREAQALAGAEHPNVIKVYDVGWSRARPGRPPRLFIAMEFVEGCSLRGWLDEPRTVEAILEVFSQAGRGIAAAHRAGLVHGDFKPENVLVGTDGRVRVADFGVARGVSQLSSSHGALPLDHGDANTLTHARGMGTPAYMPPEQMTGSATQRSDQYAFCVALFEVFCGARPFVAETWAELLDRKRAGVDERDDDGVPAHVARVWRVGLQPDPDDRFDSMEALLAALGPRQPRRRGAFVAAAAAMVTIGLAATIARGPPNACAAADRLDPATGERMTAVRDAFARSSTRFGPTATTTALEVMRERELARAEAAQQVCADLEDHRISEAEFDRRMACVEQEARRTEATLEAWAAIDDPAQIAGAVEAAAQLPAPRRCLQADPLATTLAATDAVPTWRALAQLDAAVAGADMTRARALGAQALSLARQTGNDRLIAEAMLGAARAGSSPPSEAEIDRLRDAAYLAQATGWDHGALQAALRLAAHWGQTAKRFDEAERWLEFAEAQVARMGAPTPARAKVHEARALVAHTRGELDAARSHFEHALADSDDLEPVARAYLNTRFGWFLDDTGHPSEARAYHRAAVALAEQTLGARHPTTADLRSSLAVNRLNNGDIEGSIALQRSALEDVRTALGPESPRLAKHLNNLGAAQMQAGELEAAVGSMQKALELRRSTKDEDPLAFAEALHRTAGVELATGALEEGLDHSREALVVYEDLLGGDHVRTASCRIALANAERTTGDLQSARRHAARAVASLDASFPEPHINRGAAHYALGTALGELGHGEDASRELEQALNLFAAAGAGALRLATAKYSLAIELDGLGQRERALALANEAARHLAEQAPNIELVEQIAAWIEERTPQ